MMSSHSSDIPTGCRALSASVIGAASVAFDLRATLGLSGSRWRLAQLVAARAAAAGVAASGGQTLAQRTSLWIRDQRNAADLARAEWIASAAVGAGTLGVCTCGLVRLGMPSRLMGPLTLLPALYAMFAARDAVILSRAARPDIHEAAVCGLVSLVPLCFLPTSLRVALAMPTLLPPLCAALVADATGDGSSTGGLDGTDASDMFATLAMHGGSVWRRIVHCSGGQAICAAVAGEEASDGRDGCRDASSALAACAVTEPWSICACPLAEPKLSPREASLVAAESVAAAAVSPAASFGRQGTHRADVAEAPLAEAQADAAAAGLVFCGALGASYALAPAVSARLGAPLLLTQMGLGLLAQPAAAGAAAVAASVVGHASAATRAAIESLGSLASACSGSAAPFSSSPACRFSLGSGEARDFRGADGGEEGGGADKLATTRPLGAVASLTSPFAVSAVDGRGDGMVVPPETSREFGAGSASASNERAEEADAPAPAALTSASGVAGAATAAREGDARLAGPSEGAKPVAIHSAAVSSAPVPEGRARAEIASVLASWLRWVHHLPDRLMAKAGIAARGAGERAARESAARVVVWARATGWLLPAAADAAVYGPPCAEAPERFGESTLSLRGEGMSEEEAGGTAVPSAALCSCILRAEQALASLHTAITSPPTFLDTPAAVRVLARGDALLPWLPGIDAGPSSSGRSVRAQLEAAVQTVRRLVLTQLPAPPHLPKLFAVAAASELRHELRDADEADGESGGLRTRGCELCEGACVSSGAHAAPGAQEALEKGSLELSLALTAVAAAATSPTHPAVVRAVSLERLRSLASSVAPMLDARASPSVSLLTQLRLLPEASLPPGRRDDAVDGLVAVWGLTPDGTPLWRNGY